MGETSPSQIALQLRSTLPELLTNVKSTKKSRGDRGDPRGSKRQGASLVSEQLPELSDLPVLLLAQLPLELFECIRLGHSRGSSRH